MFKHIVALNTYTEPFLSLKTNDQREIIEQLLGITLLSERAEKIKIQLDEARELKKEAQKLLASYQRKQKNVEQECNNLLAQAKEEAKNFAKEAETKLKESLARQAKAAEDKIKAAEISAVKEVQTAAAQVSIKAASEALAKDLKSGKSRGLVDDAIKELEKNFH